MKLTLNEALDSLRAQADGPLDIALCERTMRHGRTGEITYTATVSIEGGPCCESHVSLEEAVRHALDALRRRRHPQDVAELLAHEWRDTPPYVASDVFPGELSKHSVAEVQP